MRTQIQFPCKCLRCKEMFYKSHLEEEDEFSGGVYWCQKTQEPFGPDGELVGRRECGEGRACFNK